MTKRQSAAEIENRMEVSPALADMPALTADGKNAAAVALGRLGGKKGGRARAEALTADQRKTIALKAAKARWGERAEHNDE